MVNFFSRRKVEKPEAANPRETGNAVLYSFLLFCLTGYAFVGARLATLQIRDAGKYKLLAKKQSELRVVLHAERGKILDRSGKTLVTSVRAWSYGADPAELSADTKDKQHIAETFARVFGKSAGEYLQKLNTSDARFVWLERCVDEQKAAQLEGLSDPGIVRLHEPQRRYEEALAEQVIGTTNIDNEGISGIELEYDSLLHGTDGFVVLDRDGLGRKRPDEGLPQIHPSSGENLVLTIDATYQNIVENELKSGVKKVGAEAGTAVMMNPRTGEILAMATYLARHADSAGVYPSEELLQSEKRNRAITDMFEPGSTFKLVEACAALEEGAVKPDEHFYAENGTYQYQNVSITDSHPLGEITFADAVAQSSNICFAKLSQRFHPAAFYKYIRDFGFGIPTEVDIPGEVRGDVPKPEQYTTTTQAFNAFGYGLTVTPLQLTCAYAAIANGGVLMKPYVVAERIGVDGERMEKTEPQIIRRVVSRETASEMTVLLRGVVEHGTGILAQVPSLRIAGKTGTSQKVEDGTYSKEKYSASFVGYFPAEDPQIVLLIVLDAPKNGYYGGSVAAPIFKNIASRIIVSQSFLASREIQRPRDALPKLPVVTHGKNSESIPMPDIRYMNFTSADRLLGSCGLHIEKQNSGEFVENTDPPAGCCVATGATVVVHLSESGKPNNSTPPDARGLTVRQAMNLFASYGIATRVIGSGKIVNQSPPAAKDNCAEWTLYGSVSQ